jgi:hypothetical protein
MTKLDIKYIIYNLRRLTNIIDLLEIYNDDIDQSENFTKQKTLFILEIKEVIRNLNENKKIHKGQLFIFDDILKFMNDKKDDDNYLKLKIIDNLIKISRFFLKYIVDNNNILEMKEVKVLLSNIYFESLDC